jgi:hypothetical protein
MQMSGAHAQLNREIYALVQRFSTRLPDEVIAGTLVSTAFLVNLWHGNAEQAADRIGFIADALRASLQGSTLPSKQRLDLFE